MSECYDIILFLFGVLDDSITLEKRFDSPNIKTKDLVDLFVKKVSEIPKLEQKILLRNRIIQRVEEYNDSLLMTTFFNYLISKKRDDVGISSLPKLSKETFESLCDDLIKEGRMEFSKFETLTKLMMKY